MIIPINTPPHCTKPESRLPPQLAKVGTDELVLIELQGSFHIDGNPSGQLAAHLKLENEAKPTLLIGHNLLEGKVVNLSKPLAVLCKKGPSGDGMQVDGESVRQDVERTCEYDMMAVVKQKVLFSKRPMPVVSVGSISTDVGLKKVS